VTTPTPFLEFFKRGEVERDVRLMAAKGALAPRAQEQVSLLVLLLDDPDREVRSTAEATLNRISKEALAAFLARPDVPTALREFFARRGIVPDETARASAPEDEDAPLVPAESESAMPEASTNDREQTIVQRVASMSFTERLKAAVNGTRELRAILIRDTNKMISSAVLSSPKVTEPEVESFAKMANVSEDVLRTIAHRRAWMKNYGIVVALAKNSKTPVAVSMNLIPRLNSRDLQMLSIDRNVPEATRVAARKRVVESAGRR
jgi:hypothetical protein